MVNAKVAQYLNTYNEGFLLILLRRHLRFLNFFRSKYQPDDHESNIDFITFGVLDLLRCKCIGSKREIKRVYDSLRSSDFVEIIRVKNKLNESTRDILINFRIKDSFLVGEMQLALGDSKDEVNDHFCHFLYEIQRSILPCLFEVANQVVTCEPYLKYFDARHPVRFRPSTVFQELHKSIVFRNGKMRCSIFHQETEMIFLRSNVPFAAAPVRRWWLPSAPVWPT